LRKTPAGVALRRIRDEIELLESTQGSYFEIVINIKQILENAGLKVAPSPEAAPQISRQKLPPLTASDLAARKKILDTRGPRT
jgi:hypothetical protein